MFSETTATQKIAALQKKIRAVQGGTSASKTISWLLYLIALSQTDYVCSDCGRRGCQDQTHKISWKLDPKLTSTLGPNIPHLKRGAMRDFENIMKAQRYWKPERWNKTDKTYEFETGSVMEFFSADDAEKIRGGRRDRGFMNEANLMTLDAFDEFEVRTKDFVGLDWNPTNEFWFYTDVKPLRDDVDHIILTYKDNEALSQEIVDSIESRQNRPQWWKVYGLGQLGEVEGRIYTGWTQIEEMPKEARLEGYGLDFGYSNDPTAITAIYYWNGSYILDELIYQKGMRNAEIAEAMKSYESKLIVADSAEPKSIDEIRLHGIKIIPAAKGPDSVNQGIQLLQDQKILVTQRSINIWREYNNYLWERDKDGRILNKPEHGFNHALDGVRYFMQNHLKAAHNSEVSDYYSRLKYKNGGAKRVGGLR